MNVSIKRRTDGKEVRRTQWTEDEWTAYLDASDKEGAIMACEVMAFPELAGIQNDTEVIVHLQDCEFGR